MVINEKNKTLSDIKGRVTLNNIDVLEKEEKKIEIKNLIYNKITV